MKQLTRQAGTACGAMVQSEAERATASTEGPEPHTPFTCLSCTHLCIVYEDQAGASRGKLCRDNPACDSHLGDSAVVLGGSP